MNIFQIVFHNYTSPSRTRKPDNKVAYPLDYRGELTHKTELCTLCGTCVYVCSPIAIEITREAERGVWDYDGGRCTYCGKCVEFCPTGALNFCDHSPSTITNRQQELIKDIVEYRSCIRCGAKIIPIPMETLVKLYHSEEAAQYASKIYELCERCRSRLHSQSIKSGISGVNG